LNIATLEKYDIQKMYKIYDKWPEIARESFESEQKPIDFQNIDYIVFGGMGGSGAIGDIFESILSKTKIHVNVVKGYVLPETVNSNTLVVIVSVSGNTNETLSLLESSKKINCNIIAFSSGGKIQEYCIKNDVKHISVTKFHSPRATFPSFLYTMLKVLHQTLKIKGEDIIDSIKNLENLQKIISSSNLTENNVSLNLAKSIKSIPIIYYPSGLQSASIRFKNSLQENAKMHAISEDVIEASHNGIVSWERKSHTMPILIRGSGDHIKTKERYEILKEFFIKKKINYEEIISIEGNILSKLITLIYLLDYATIYKAVMDNIDPSPVNPIEYVKNKIDQFT
jgi:glucose/mannose-6-phosphate isomerase